MKMTRGHTDTAIRRSVSARTPSLALAVCTLALILIVDATVAQARSRQEQLVPILAISLGANLQPKGVVANLILGFEERSDRTGLAVVFRKEPGRFSKLAQTAVQQAIYRTARAAGMSTDSWTVILSVPYPGLTVYGESLSAMIALSVLAMAKGDFIAPDRVITGAVTPEGRIAPVGSVPQKVEAATRAHMRRIVVPDEQDVADRDWQTPFLIQISPVGTVDQAYLALTDHPLLIR